MNRMYKIQTPIYNLVRGLLKLSCGFFLAGYSVNGMCMPLGVSYIGSRLFGGGDAFSVFGVCLGYLWHFKPASVKAYIGAIVCLIVMLWMLRGSSAHVLKHISAWSSGVLVGLFLSFGAIMGNQDDAFLVNQVIGPVVTTIFCSYVFNGVLLVVNIDRNPIYDLAFGGFLGIVLIGACNGRTSTFIFLMAECVALLISLFYARPRSAIVGTGMCGLLLLVGALDYVSTLLVYCAWMLGNLLYENRKITFVLTICFVIIFSAIVYSDHERTFEWVLLYAIVILVYLTISPYTYGRLLMRLYSLFECAESMEEEIQVKLIPNIPKEILNLLEIDLVEAKEEYLAEEVVRDAFVSVCTECEMNTLCRKQGRDMIENAYLNALYALKTYGRMEKSGFSKEFSEYCGCSKELVFAINRNMIHCNSQLHIRELIKMNRNIMLSLIGDLAYTTDELYSAEKKSDNTKRYKILLDLILSIYGLKCDVDVVRMRYGGIRICIWGDDISTIISRPTILSELSHLMGIKLQMHTNMLNVNLLELYEMPSISVEVGIAQMKCQGQDVCGDSVGAFVTREGVFYGIIADGMGCGREANKQSMFAIEFLETVLQKGISAQKAMSMLRNVICFRNMDSIHTAAVDLVSVNLFSGETAIYKYGAAPSYFVRSGEISEFAGENLPAGLQWDEDWLPNERHCQLNYGDLIVMTSDGIVLQRNQILQNTQCEQKTSLKETAKGLLMKTEAINRVDDMTVMVVGLSPKSEPY